MRGCTRIGILVISLPCMFTLTPASASALPQLWTDNTRTTLLRDVNTTPAHQPDAVELATNGAVELKTTVGTITCAEVDLGSTVASNTETLAKLALPFGVAEGDGCKVGGTNVPTYFDTLASGAVGNAANGNVASVTVTEPKAGELAATVNDLKLSHNVPGVGFCTSDLNGIKATITNVVAEFVEETPPNLNVQFTKAKVPITGAGCPTEGEFTANFLLETSSTTTDTAFFEVPPFCVKLEPIPLHFPANSERSITIKNLAVGTKPERQKTTEETEYKIVNKAECMNKVLPGPPGECKVKIKHGAGVAPAKYQLTFECNGGAGFSTESSLVSP